MSLLGKLAFVTGAGSGIGRAVCQIFSREGAHVIAADCNGNAALETIRSLPSEHNNKHLSLTVDVSQSTSVKNSLQQVLDVYNKPPSIVVNCAGIVRDNFLLKLSEEDFQQVLDVNLKGTFLILQTFTNAMLEGNVQGGNFINIGSIIGKRGNIGQANYAASKAGVELLTKTAVKEFGQYGIRCNAVLPGYIKTPMTAPVPEKVQQHFLALIASRRFGEPHEVAEVVAFLASDKSSYVNGAAIEVTGGFY